MAADPAPPKSEATRKSPSRRSLVGLVLIVLAISALNSWWAQRQQSALGREVAALAAPGDLQMLSSDTCAICVVARRWLTENEVPFSECSIERDPACRDHYEALRAPGTPVILVRGQAQLGFDPARLRDRLRAD